MGRIVIIFVAVLLTLLAAGFVLLGAFPPHLVRTPVAHVLNNDKFQGH
jgi:hypothetical protein